MAQLQHISMGLLTEFVNTSISAFVRNGTMDNIRKWAAMEKIDECVSQPCLNDGTCETLESGYFCWCTEERSGNRCESTKFDDLSFLFNWFLVSGYVTVACMCVCPFLIHFNQL